MSDLHVDTDLSAYLDGELAPAERARVQAHLDACATCRSHVGELRSTASLIAALPTARPSRSLVPRVTERYNWLRPLRSISTFATGAFLFVFVLTAVGRSGSGLGGGGATTGAVPEFRTTTAAAPAATAAAAPERVAIATPQALPVAPGAGDAVRAFTPAPAPAAADAARSPSPAPLTLQAPTTPTAAQKSAEAVPRPAPPRAESFGSTPGADTALRDARRAPPPFTDPLVWLGFAVIAAVVAIGAHWRLRNA